MKRVIVGIFTTAIVVANSVNKVDIVDTEPVVDAYERADTNISVSAKNIDRSKYMPRLITPENLKSGIYGGFGLGLAALGFDTTPSIFTDKNGNNRMLDLAVIAGYNYSKYLALETRTTVSVVEDNGLDVTSASLFFKPKYEVYKNVNLYSLIGYGVVDAKQVNSSETKGKSKGVQLGVGADYSLGKNFKVFADYLYRGKDSNAKHNDIKSIMKSSAITGGITYDF